MKESKERERREELGREVAVEPPTFPALSNPATRLRLGANLGTSAAIDE
jgi:hypothetical protein